MNIFIRSLPHNSSSKEVNFNKYIFAGFCKSEIFPKPDNRFCLSFKGLGLTASYSFHGLDKSFWRDSLSFTLSSGYAIFPVDTRSRIQYNA